MHFPDTLQYSASHEWVRTLDNGLLEIGLTDHAQSELGDLVFVNLPQAGDMVTVDESFGDVESVKAVSDVYSPVTGTVEAVNEDLLDTPGAINENPYGAWLIRVSDVTATGPLMDAAAYQSLLEQEG